MFRKIGFLAAVLFMFSSLVAQKDAKAPKAPKDGKPKITQKEIAPAVNVYFATGKSLIKKEEMAKLDKMIEDLKSKKEFNLILTGHTDSTGNDDDNLALSRDRVDAVFDYLAEKGMPEDLMKVNYFGSAKPVAKGTDPDKLQMNRRVEIFIVEKEKPVEKPKPVFKDTCGRDTTVSLGKGVSITMNKCEYTRLFKNGSENLQVDVIKELDEILDSEFPLMTKKNEAMLWGGIVTVKVAGDTCLKHPATIKYSLDVDAYKKAKFTNQYKATSDDKIEADKKGKVSTKKTKSDVIVSTPVSCSGKFCVVNSTGKNMTSKFKDKTGRIREMYVVSSNPVIIIPATRIGNKFIVNYKNISDAKLVIKLTDDTVIRDLDINAIKKTKKKDLLNKKYKIKKRHLKTSSN